MGKYERERMKRKKNLRDREERKGVVKGCGKEKSEKKLGGRTGKLRKGQRRRKVKRNWESKEDWEN